MKETPVKFPVILCLVFLVATIFYVTPAFAMDMEYYYYIDVDKTAITEYDINNTIEEANGLLRTFNPYE